MENRPNNPHTPSEDMINLMINNATPYEPPLDIRLDETNEWEDEDFSLISSKAQDD